MQENHSNIEVESSKEIEELMVQPANNSTSNTNHTEKSAAEQDHIAETSSDGMKKDSQHNDEDADSDQLYTLEVVDPDEQSEDLGAY
jgi:hypothetical protein